MQEDGETRRRTLLRIVWLHSPSKSLYSAPQSSTTGLKSTTTSLEVQAMKRGEELSQQVFKALRENGEKRGKQTNGIPTLLVMRLPNHLRNHLFDTYVARQVS